MNKISQPATLILRLGMAVVFLWFGTQQLMDPTPWIGFVPDYATNPWLSATTLVLLNGWFEVIAAGLLIIGFRLKPAALLLSLHMFQIAISAGGATGVRDFGIAVACLSLAMLTADNYMLDHKLTSHV